MSEVIDMSNAMLGAANKTCFLSKAESEEEALSNGIKGLEKYIGKRFGAYFVYNYLFHDAFHWELYQIKEMARKMVVDKTRTGIYDLMKEIHKMTNKSLIEEDDMVQFPFHDPVGILFEYIEIHCENYTCDEDVLKELHQYKELMKSVDSWQREYPELNKGRYCDDLQSIINYLDVILKMD